MIKDYSKLTDRIYTQLSPELSKEFHNMLTEMAQEISRLYEIDNAKPSEALIDLEKISNCYTFQDGTIDFCYDKEVVTIKQALLKAQEQENEIYVIYCVNNYHNVYMNYRGKPCDYSGATLFKDKFEAHKFLRNNNKDSYYIWKVVNNKDLTDDEKEVLNRE